MVQPFPPFKLDDFFRRFCFFFNGETQSEIMKRTLHGKHMESTWNGLKHRSIHPRPIITSRLVESITARIETVINLNSLERPCMLRHLLHKNDWIIYCRCDPRDSIDGIRFISIIAAADERPRNDSPAGRPDSD